jgi:hypothetical protein
MRISTFAMSALVIVVPDSWADGVNVFRGETLAATFGDDAGNLVDLFVQDFAARSGTPNYFIQIVGFGPDVGEFSCTGATVFGSPITDPLNVTDGAKHGTAVFTTMGLTDDQGQPCRTDVQVLVACSSSDDGDRETCSTRSTSFGTSTRIKFNSWNVSADCTLQVQAGDFTLQGTGDTNGALQVSHSLNNL